MGDRAVETGAPSRAGTDVAAEPPGVRGSRAIAVFGTWMLVGLFVDGWAHSAQKPESFFSPWHGLLYSGFVAAVAWFAWNQNRGEAAVVDRLATTGLVLFVIGAVGDGVWHTVFGIEVDIEALLSPTHLALMVGGALMVSAPFRLGWATLPERPDLRDLVAPLASATLVTSLVLFFLMYLSAAGPIAADWRSSEDMQAFGVASVLVRTVVMLGATQLLLRRWTPPFGAFTLLFTVPSIALAGLDGFEPIALAAPFVLGGLVADGLVLLRVGGRRLPVVVGVVVPAVCWLGYFAVHAVVWGVHWPAEIWTGSVVFAVMAGLGLALLANGLEGEPAR